MTATPPTYNFDFNYYLPLYFDICYCILPEITCACLEYRSNRTTRLIMYQFKHIAKFNLIVGANGKLIYSSKNMFWFNLHWAVTLVFNFTHYSSNESTLTGAEPKPNFQYDDSVPGKPEPNLWKLDFSSGRTEFRF